MESGRTEELLARIADALDRLAPGPVTDVPVEKASALVWNSGRLEPVADSKTVPLNLLTGIDDQKARLCENTARHAAGHAAHDILLWGARGMGKSALVKAGAAESSVTLIEARADELATLPQLFERLGSLDRRFILFIDDIGFEDETSARMMRSMLEGGIRHRPANVRVYVTANRRHIVAREMSEQDDPVNVRDVLDDRLALSDRFGLRLGFHAASQADYLAMVESYAVAYDLPFDAEDALGWSRQHGGRSGRMAWHYITEMAGREGRNLA